MSDDTTWLVNQRTHKHIGPFTTRMDALFAMNIAADPWQPMGRAEFDAHLEGLELPEHLRTENGR